MKPLARQRVGRGRAWDGWPRPPPGGWNRPGADPVEIATKLINIDEKTLYKEPNTSRPMRAHTPPEARRACCRLAHNRWFLPSHSRLPTTNVEEPVFRMCALPLLDELEHVFMPPADHAVTPHLHAVTGRNGNGDRIIVDIQPDILDNFHMSAFLSLFVLTTHNCGSALRHTPAPNPRFGKADTLRSFIASHTD